MSTAIVWFENDLRLHDLPALAAAAAASEVSHVLPLYIFYPQERQRGADGATGGIASSANRSRFLVECLSDLRAGLEQRHNSRLYIREGPAEQVLPQVARRTKSRAVYCTADFTPEAVARHSAVREALSAVGVELHCCPGRLVVDGVERLRTHGDGIFKVFTPFWRAWERVPRRQVLGLVERVPPPPKVKAFEPGELPKLKFDSSELSPNVLVRGGETAARARLAGFLEGAALSRYADDHNDLASLSGTSRLSPDLRFGTISVREAESRLPARGAGAEAWRRQLCWRDFYYYVLLHSPENADQEFQPRYRGLNWVEDEKLLQAWKNGRTGYPVVDAAMRQLLDEGWMHNRGRLIVGSFLTKDLGVDWRQGEAHFMRWLLDGDQANNNGNWQWIAGVGVDPAPVYRRLFNPRLQQRKFDPEGEYVRRHVPELRNVPDEFLVEPATMPLKLQRQVGCVIGEDYPQPIVDHARAREATLKRYRSI